MAAYAPESGGGRASPFDTGDGDCAAFKPYELEGLSIPHLTEQANEMLAQLYGTNLCIQRKVKALTTAVGLLNSTTTVVGFSLLSQLVSLTDAQIKSLSSVPVIAVTAPVAGYIAFPISYLVHTKLTVGYSGSRNISLKYSGNSNDLTGTVQAVGTTAADVYLMAGQATAIAANIAGGEAAAAKDVVVHITSGGDVTGGNAANYIKVLTTYILVPELI